MILLSDIEELYTQSKKLTSNGNCADYIPLLAKADKDDLGIFILDGDNRICVGKYDSYFTIQSISKIAGLMCALLEHGKDKVFNFVGYNGTEEAFNTFYKLEFPYSETPQNPMINSGAIVVTSLISGNKFQRILDLLKVMTSDNELNYNYEVYISEKQTGNRNKGLAYILKALGVVYGDVEETVDAYFKQCSINVTCKHLSKMARFIGSGCKGLPQDMISNEELTKILMGIMSSAGMYNYSGQYMVEVGMPSKSGVGGGVMAIGPRGVGIGVYGPSLDKSGNSIAGMELLKLISKKYNYNIYLNY